MIWPDFAKDKNRVWELWLISKAYQTRPSALAGMTDDIRAFYFDRGVRMFGTMIEVEADQAEANAKSAPAKRAARARVMAKYLNNGSTSGRFRDPAAPKLGGDTEEVNLGGDFFAGL